MTGTQRRIRFLPYCQNVVANLPGVSNAIYCLSYTVVKNQNILIEMKKLYNFFFLNIKIGIVLGILGLVVFLIGYPISQKNQVNYTYHIYDSSRYKYQDALYVRQKKDIDWLNSYFSSGQGLIYSNSSRYLSKYNKAWIMDTLDGDIVKFKAITLAHDSSEVIRKGYTHINYIQMSPAQ